MKKAYMPPMGLDLPLFRDRFRRVSRPEREMVLCAMIRVNYGTPWDGDKERLKNFFPHEFYQNLVFGGLTELIEALNPFADEPTDYSVSPDEATIKEAESTVFRKGEVTSSLPQATTELRLPQRETATIKISAV